MKNHNEKTLKEALQVMVEHYRLKSRLNQTRIRAHWAEMMGPSIMRYTREIKMGRKKLYIYLDSAPLRQELSMGKEKIRRMLNEKLGEDYIQEVVIM
ncbi:MAG: DUF721 domain-containing protein [Saprospiraceae bacterium]